MKYPFGRHVDVNNLGHHHLKGRQKKTLARLAHVKILGGRHADDSRGINRLAPVRYRSQVKYRIVLGH